VLGKGSLTLDYYNVLYNAFSGSASPYTRVKGSWKQTGGTYNGLRTSIGCEIYFIEGLNIFCDFSYQIVNYTPQIAALTALTEDGTDLLSSMTVSEKEIEYVDEYDNENATTPTSPQKQNKNTYSFNSLILNLGINIPF
jgi:hypothetical protein